MESSSKKVIYAALAGNALIAVTKFIAAVVTGSSAMLSEGIHSIVDTGNELLLLYGIHRAKKPADELFPFGYGKEIYFWSFVVAIFIFAVGAGASLYEGIRHLSHPRPLEHVYANYFVLVLAMFFEGATWTVAFKEFSHRKGRRSYLEMVHRAKNPSIFVVGFLLAGTAIWLAYVIKGLLVGESAQPEVVQGIRWLAGRYPEIEHVNEILTMHMGPEFILVNLSVDFKNSLSAEQVERTVQKLDVQIKQAYPRVKRIFIEGEARRSRTES